MRIGIIGTGGISGSHIKAHLNQPDVEIVAGVPTTTTVPLLPATTDLWNRKIRSFLDACITGGKAPVPTDEIVYNQAILDGINRSSKLGKEVEIEIPEI